MVPLATNVAKVVAKAEKRDGDDEDEEEQEEAEADVEEEEEGAYAEKGWWVHRKSREPLGGADGRLEFTLVECVRLIHA